MASFDSFGKDNWNKVWPDSFGHVMLLASVPALYDTDSIVNGTILLGQDGWNKV